MQMILLTALGVGGATVIGALGGFAFKKISHKFSDIVLAFAAGVMLAAAVIGLCVVAFVLKKTKLFEVTAPVISWAGIALSVGLVAFFMIFPTVVWCAKTTLAAPVLWENVTTFFSVLF